MRSIAALAIAAVSSSGLASTAVFAADIAAGTCADSYVIAAESETSWTITCGTSTTPLVTFDPEKLTQFKLNGKTNGVELMPDLAPQPLTITLPVDAPVDFKALKSSNLRLVDITGPLFDKRKAAVNFAANTFVGLTALKGLGMDRFNVTGTATPWTIPGSLERLSFMSVGMDRFDAKVEGEGTQLNLTTVSFSGTTLKEIPSFIFSAPLIESLSFYDTKFGPLTMSRKRFDRLQKLRPQSFAAENYVGDCAGGKKETISLSTSPFVVCVMPTGKDDDLVYVPTPPPTPAPTTKAPKTPEPTMSKEEKKELEKLLGKLDSSAVTSVGGWFYPSAGLVLAALVV